MERNERRKGRGWKLFGCGCLTFAVLLGGLGVLLHTSSGRRIDDRTERLEEEIVAHERLLEELPKLRVGEPLEGNAYRDYALAEYVLGSNAAWADEPPPWLPETHYAADDPTVEGHDLELLRSAARGDADSSRAVELEALLERYAPLCEQVRVGLQRDAVRWPCDLRNGAAGELPSMPALHDLAHLLSLQAERADADTAARVGLEIVAFGQDLRRAPSLVMQMNGIAVQSLGYEALQKSLSRGPSAETLVWLEQKLAEVRSQRLIDVMSADRTAMLVTIVGAAGRFLGGNTDVGIDPAPDLYVAWELGQVEPLYERSVQLFALPRSQWAAASAQLTIDIEESWSIIARMVIPNLSRAGDSFHEDPARRACLRVAIAALRWQREHGAAPNSIAELSGLLDIEACRDPFTGKPLRTRSDGTHLWIYSVGRDGRDDGGKVSLDGAADDLGLVLRLP